MKQKQWVNVSVMNHRLISEMVYFISWRPPISLDSIFLLQVLFTALPVVHMYAIQGSARDPKLYQCPVYKKPTRTDLNYITFILLRTTKPPEDWILRGVAALCDIK